MSSKFIAFALLAVANAAEIYYATWPGSGSGCEGTVNSYSLKATLDTCFKSPRLTKEMFKITLTGSTYAYEYYSFVDTTCTGTHSAFRGTIDTCADAGLRTVEFTTSYASGASTCYDCTSGTCSEDSCMLGDLIQGLLVAAVVIPIVVIVGSVVACFFYCKACPGYKMCNKDEKDENAVPPESVGITMGAVENSEENPKQDEMPKEGEPTCYINGQPVYHNSSDEDVRKLRG